jgi:hypothetical protein
MAHQGRGEMTLASASAARGHLSPTPVRSGTAHCEVGVAVRDVTPPVGVHNRCVGVPCRSPFSSCDWPPAAFGRPACRLATPRVCPPLPRPCALNACVDAISELLLGGEGTLERMQGLSHCERFVHGARGSSCSSKLVTGAPHACVLRVRCSTYPPSAFADGVFPRCMHDCCCGVSGAGVQQHRMSRRGFTSQCSCMQWR